ncbi:MAG: D-alanyl-D-alanine dipeptidase [Bacteroidota bacterium]
MKFLLKIILTLFFFNSGTNLYAQLTIVTSSQYDSIVNKFPNLQLVSLKSDFIQQDIKYATSNNFTHEIVYDTAALFLALDAHKAILKVVEFLKPYHVGLIFYDAYRPYRYTIKFWEIIHDERYVADPQKGSRHNRGCAVDVGLFNLKTGVPLDMPTAYDDFSEKASVSSKDRTKLQTKNVELLQKAMTSCGFQLFATEWWHFDYEGWQKYPIYDISFQYLSQ